MTAQPHNVFLDFFDDGLKDFIRLSGRILQLPVIIEGPAYIRASHITPHGDRNIGSRDIFYRLCMLRLFHVNAVQLFHHTDSIRINAGLYLRTGRITLKDIPCQIFSKSLGNLAPAGVMNTDKCDFLLSQGALHLLRFQCFPHRYYLIIDHSCGYTHPAYVLHYNT